jgi:hypothetical protein
LKADPNDPDPASERFVLEPVASASDADAPAEAEAW